MYAFDRSVPSARHLHHASPSEELRIAVTFKRPHGGFDRALEELNQLGFRSTRSGKLTASVRCTRVQFESTFGTQLEPVGLNPTHDYAFQSFYYHKDDAPWTMPERLAGIIDHAYIQWPHLYMKAAAGRISATPPQVDYYHLDVPKGVPALLNATQVHAKGTTGKGVRVAMVDSGFARHHPYFVKQGYKMSVDLAPHAINDATDTKGHGTGEAANLLAVAPDVTFVGIKVDNDDDPRLGASMLEGFQTALHHQPQVISMSMGFDLRGKDGKQQSELPNSLAALEAEIQAAVARGITVVFSAGNGHFSFPGMMPEVISAGGVFVDEHGGMQASNYASAFHSKIFPGRSVPDFSGLVGLLPHATYIMLPVPAGSEIDHESAQPKDSKPGDGTAPDDGWGVFSGTSAAAPQLAGVCALLLEKNPGLTPGDIKSVLRRSARSVTKGSANPSSSDNHIGEPAKPGDRGAAGAGLVDALAAWKQI